MFRKKETAFPPSYPLKEIPILGQEQVRQKLLSLNGSMLKKEYAKKWSRDNPTLGYCYIVSEALYHYLEGDIKAFCINLGSELGTHWFVKIDGIVTDYTGEQFSEPIDYSKAIGKGFFKGSVQTPKGFISKRGFEMAKHLELV